MGKKLNCWVCGKEHDYCPTCGQTHGWKYIADTPLCYQTYMTLEDTRAGALSQEDAVKAFADLGICAESNLSWLRPHIEKSIREIIGEKKKETKTTKKSKLFE